SGASGLRSQVSRWLGPPQSRMKMQDFLVERPVLPPPPPTRAATRPGVARLSRPMPPSWRRRRRERREEALIRWVSSRQAGGRGTTPSYTTAAALSVGKMEESIGGRGDTHGAGAAGRNRPAAPAPSAYSIPAPVVPRSP